MEAAMEVVEAAIQAMEAEVESACAVGQAAVSEGEAAVSEEESADGAVSDVAQEQEQGGEQEQQEQQEVPDLDGANYIPPLNGALTLDETALPTVDIDADVDVDAPELTTPADTADSESLDGLDSIASASASASAKTDNVVDGDVDPQFALQAFDSMTSTPAPKVVSESKGEDKGAEDSGKGVYEKHVRRLMFILDQEQQARARVEDKLDRAMQQIVQQKEPKSKKNDTIKVFARSWFGKKEKKENKDELHNSTAQLSRREENAAQFDYNDREAALAETLEIAQV
ncbi:hypothetical protein B484DRAFT_280780 [Ochromonadaceae sp. CCMP2298]|nr:hypothetical protein B484DRAFT_280780 [Ochromonadaceae sp. CCMP2298]